MALELAKEIKTDEDAFKFYHRADELLRLEHNRQGEAFKQGKINKIEWEEYKEKSFKPRLKRLHAEKNALKEKLDLVRDYAGNELEEARRIAEEGKVWKEVDKYIDLTKV